MPMCVWFCVFCNRNLRGAVWVHPGGATLHYSLRLCRTNEQREERCCRHQHHPTKRDHTVTIKRETQAPSLRDLNSRERRQRQHLGERKGSSSSVQRSMEWPTRMAAAALVVVRSAAAIVKQVGTLLPRSPTSLGSCSVPSLAGRVLYVVRHRPRCRQRVRIDRNNYYVPGMDSLLCGSSSSISRSSVYVDTDRY
jgi:hypothetical protein